jgi:hypothetical protein
VGEGGSYACITCAVTLHCQCFYLFYFLIMHVLCAATLDCTRTPTGIPYRKTSDSAVTLSIPYRQTTLTDSAFTLHAYGDAEPVHQGDDALEPPLKEYRC